MPWTRKARATYRPEKYSVPTDRLLSLSGCATVTPLRLFGVSGPAPFLSKHSLTAMCEHTEGLVSVRVRPLDI